MTHGSAAFLPRNKAQMIQEKSREPEEMRQQVASPSPDLPTLLLSTAAQQQQSAQASEQGDGSLWNRSKLQHQVRIVIG
ncbi:MAG: hypothetical protein RL117_628, partial [Verrucomicrobiota bacterium]